MAYGNFIFSNILDNELPVEENYNKSRPIYRGKNYIKNKSQNNCWRETMKTLVLYKTGSGFTKKYAEWIAEELSSDIFDVSVFDAKKLSDYDNIIYGGSLHASGILGIKFITKNFDKLKGKKVVVFATGASPVREQVINQVTDKNFTQDQQKQIKFFYLRGGFDFNKLKFFDKVIMTLFKWVIQRKKELTPDEKGMLEAYNKPMDFTRKEDIEQIVSYINS